MRGSIATIAAAASAALLLAAPGGAQVGLPDDPYAGDPTGIVDLPCPAHPYPKDEGGRRAWQLHRLARDWAQLCRYAEQNEALKREGKSVRVVFMGDSITDNWINLDPAFFTGGLVDRGISGQTTAQMLVRFRQDVLDLHPRAVHIMAGTNDIAGNTGAATMATVEGHIESMAELARAHGVKVIIGAIPPAAAFPWSPDKKPAPQVVAINAWLKAYARRNHFAFADYHGAMRDGSGGMKPGLSSDGVHPTREGYRVMAPIAHAAIRAALGR